MIRRGKKRPTTLFEQVFFDMNENIKKMRADKSKQIIISLNNTIKKDFSNRGYDIQITAKLGSFRGHPYVTSAIILLKPKGKQFVENDIRFNKILNYLQSTYTPKYKFKGLKDGVAKFNIR